MARAHLPEGARHRPQVAPRAPRFPEQRQDRLAQIDQHIGTLPLQPRHEPQAPTPSGKLFHGHELAHAWVARK